MRSHTTRSFQAALTCGLVVLAVATAPPAAAAEPTTIWVSATGSGNGQSATEPMSVQALADLDLAPGTRVELTGTKPIDRTVVIDGADAGSPSQPVVVTTAGSSVQLAPPPGQPAVRVVDATGVSVLDIEIAGTRASAAVEVTTERTGEDRPEAVTVSGVVASGVATGVTVTGTKVGAGVRGLRVAGVSVDSSASASVAVAGPAAAPGNEPSHLDVRISGVQAPVRLGSVAGAVVDVQAFRDLLDSVAHTASKDETLPVLTAINVVFSADRITAYATDRYRLARAWIPSPVAFEGSFLIKLSEWKRIRVLMDKPGDMHLLLIGPVGCSKFETVHFSGKDFAVNALTVNGEYPELRKLFAKDYSSHMVFSVAAMKRASRVIGSTTERNQTFELTSTEDRTALRISTTWEENPAKSPLIPAEGEADVRTAFNPYFYQEALRALPGDKVRLSFATMAQPVRITSGLEPLDSVVLEQLVMPVRLPPKQDK